MNKSDILKSNSQRYVLFPIKYGGVWNMYKKAQASFWTAEEIDLATDKVHFSLKLTNDERYFIKQVLAFFASADGIVNENLSNNFINEIQIPEARCFYAFQTSMENVHSETYSLLIDTLVVSNTEKMVLFDAINSNDPLFLGLRAKAEWAIRWIKKDATFAARLVANACIEGIFFSGSFCSIFWLKKRGLMPGLTFSNELISRDEGLHVDFACMLYDMLHAEDKLSDSMLKDIIISAVDVEKHFVRDALPVELIGMNAKLMTQYIEFVADRLAVSFGIQKIYNTYNPFDWMEMISLQGKTNFFERRVGEYSKASVVNKTNADTNDSKIFTIEADF